MHRQDSSTRSPRTNNIMLHGGWHVEVELKMNELDLKTSVHQANRRTCSWSTVCGHTHSTVQILHGTRCTRRYKRDNSEHVIPRYKRVHNDRPPSGSKRSPKLKHNNGWIGAWCGVEGVWWCPDGGQRGREGCCGWGWAGLGCLGQCGVPGKLSRMLASQLLPGKLITAALLAA